MTVRARGTKFQLLGKAEGTAGTQATGNYDTLPCYSFEVDAALPLTKDPVLGYGIGRDPIDPFTDVLSVKGNAEFPIEIGTLPGHLTRAFGATVTTGSGPHTDTWTAGGAVPSVTFEKGFTDEGSYHQYIGCKVDTFTIDIAANGAAKLKLALIGTAAPAPVNASVGGTPVGYSFVRILNKAAKFTVGGSAIANVISGSIAIGNGLEEIRTVRDDSTGGPFAIDDGLQEGSGTLVLRYDSDTLITPAMAGTPLSLALVFDLGSGHSISFNFPRAYLERPAVPVKGPAGVEQSVKFMAAHDAGAGCMFNVAWLRA